jgi:hypothetical protein
MNKEFDRNKNFFDPKKNEKPKVDSPKEDRPSLPIKLELEDPIEWGDEIISTLVFSKKLNGEMMAHLPVDEKLIQLGHFFPLIGGMTCQPYEVVERLTRADLNKATAIVTDFF